MVTRRVVVVISIAAAMFAAVVVLLVLTAPPAQAPGNEGGPGLPVVIDGERYPGQAVALSGSLVVGTEGCFRLAAEAEERFLIWPQGYTAGGDAVVDPEGEIIPDGAQLDVKGVLVPYAELIAIEGPDGYWASVAGFCIGDDTTVLVLEDVVAQ